MDRYLGRKIDGYINGKMVRLINKIKFGDQLI